MSRRHRDNGKGDLPGQDSFLDIIANMVGILILLVVIVGIGAAASTVPEASTAAADSPPLVTAAEVEATQRNAARLAREANDLQRKATRLNADANDLDYERDKLATYVTAAKQELDRRRGELAGDDREQYDLRVDLVSAEEKLDELMRKQIALVSAPLETEQIKNVPTPLSKVVEGDEISLRVEAGRVAVLPVDALVGKLKALGPNEFQRLRSRRDPVGRVGPIGGFQMFYTIVTQRSVGRGGMAVVTPHVVMEVRPMNPHPGEPIDEAINPGSRLMAELRRHDSRTTAVTLWTYPDSFEEVSQLRQMLYEQGFATAIRPLPKGSHYAASSLGTASRVQ